ncbi:peptidylprolyl isomerase [Candidatus Persebacteraceae bacterium Df01]|jgi:peptidyl-prolyl cis-trans isomerase C|uniref:peptidylprolyl isomerase n=1 Tax=Candidatus Doriopsillibacter californiensis TaxID=2970740 RepID=A0ABT7QM12_9GAMM|nr:peptidylprolyl isomerase [Candidatus Persebacteraceae bacterium Df01]
MKKNYYLLLLAAFFVTGCSNANDETTGTSSDTEKPAVTASEDTIVTIDGDAIPVVRLEAYMRPGSNETREQVLENVIASEIISRAARAAGLHEKADIAQQLVIQEQTVLGRAYTQQFLEENQVTEEQITLRYEELKNEFANRKEYSAAHILTKDEEKAKTIYKQVSENPEKFAELAKEHSEDPGSAQNGGSLGWVESRVFVPEFAAALEMTDAGELASGPVQSQFGWHIILVEDTRPLSVPPFNDEMRERLRQAVRIELFTEHLDGLRAKANIVINEQQ